jgi:hypothetical protein
MKKSCGQRQLSARGTTKPPRCQASKRLVIPYKVKEGSKARKEEEAKGRSIKSIRIPIHLLKNNTQRAGL